LGAATIFFFTNGDEENRVAFDLERVVGLKARGNDENSIASCQVFFSDGLPSIIIYGEFDIVELCNAIENNFDIYNKPNWNELYEESEGEGDLDAH
jgi:hypothetical protein